MDIATLQLRYRLMADVAEVLPDPRAADRALRAADSLEEAVNLINRAHELVASANHEVDVLTTAPDYHIALDQVVDQILGEDGHD